MKKRIITLLIICLIIITLSFVFNGRTIYLGSYTKVFTIGSKVFKFSNNKKVVLRPVYAYKKGNKVKGYLKSTPSNDGNEYYVVSKNNNKIDQSFLIASGRLSNIKVFLNDNNVNIDISVLSEINALLDKNLSIDNIYSYSKINQDINNDFINEDIIYVVYMENDQFVTRIFINSNDNITDIINYEYDIDQDSSISYGLAGLIDFNKDDNYEIIVSKVDGDSKPAYYSIYRYENGIIKELK